MNIENNNSIHILPKDSIEKFGLGKQLNTKS